MSLWLAWSAELVPGQPQLHRETLFQRTKDMRAGELAQLLKATVTKDLGSIPSTHMETHNLKHQAYM